MVTEEKKNDAIDALIRNLGDDNLFVDDFMAHLDITQELMMEDHPARWAPLLEKAGKDGLKSPDFSEG